MEFIISNEADEKGCLDTSNSVAWISQITARYLIELLAILSSLFIIITIQSSSRHRYWPFRLLVAQVIAEAIDLALALTFTFYSGCIPKTCAVVGYIMHASWITSFLCSLFITLNYFFILKKLSWHLWMKKHLKYVILSLFIIPYLVYVYPLINNGFGPTGWQINQKKRIIFCGWQSKELYYQFWMGPLLAIQISQCLLVIYLCKKTSILTEVKELQFSTRRIRLYIVFPLFYTLSWIVNIILRVIDLQQSSATIQLENSFSFVCYTVFNLVFELHLVIGAFIFYITYNGFMDINKVWKRLLTGRKRESSSQISDLQMYLEHRNMTQEDQRNDNNQF